MVRSVTRQIEPEFDDDTRAGIEGIDRYDDECCEGCGFHKSVLDDFENRHFTWDERYCPACADIARYKRVLAERDDKSTPKDHNGHPAWDGPRERRPDDGRFPFIRAMTPAEIEERTRRADAAAPRKRHR